MQLAKRLGVSCEAQADHQNMFNKEDMSNNASRPLGLLGMLADDTHNAEEEISPMTSRSWSGKIRTDHDDGSKTSKEEEEVPLPRPSHGSERQPEHAPLKFVFSPGNP